CDAFSMFNFKDKFALIVNIGGYFLKCGPIVDYLGGSLKSIYGLDKLGVNKYEKIVYRIPSAGVGADSLKDITDDKGVMEIISCGNNRKTVVQIYVVGGDINDDREGENTQSASHMQDIDDRQEVNGLRRLRHQLRMSLQASWKILLII
ncbi:translation initiation factor IF-2, partial [Striga asiatica]